MSKRPTATQFQQLLISNFCFDGYDLECEPKTDQQKVEQIAKIMRSELGFMSEQGHGDKSICLHWLQGLASACTIPFYNGAILEWWEHQTGTPIRCSKHEYVAIETYWEAAANCLAVMIQRAERGAKV